MKVCTKDKWLIVNRTTQKLVYPELCFTRKRNANTYLSSKHPGVKPHELFLLFEVKSLYEILKEMSDGKIS